VGGEGPGLPHDLVERCDERVTIPMAPQVESLNAAVAGALLVYAARRQRRTS
jgi:tRNA G18 (ribose-2'-O)-methylase SpoU